MLTSLTYISTATRLFLDPEMDQLLATSRAKNTRLDITGLLLYRPHGFIQTIEGPETAVLALLDTIKADHRHKNLTVIIYDKIETRDFENWSMGFYRISDHPDGFNDFLTNNELAERFHRSPKRSHQLLATFRELFSRE